MAINKTFLPLNSSTVSLHFTSTNMSSHDLNLTASSDTKPKPTVLIAEKLSESGLELLRESTSIDCSYGLSPDQLAAKISSCDALIVRSGTKVFSFDEKIWDPLRTLNM
jgi:D-3-phosphoglycerate dehydrogenase / 2-oxoglutarate reductase